MTQMNTDKAMPIPLPPDGHGNNSLLHPASPLRTSQMELFQGQKRTATGEIKSAAFNGVQRGNNTNGSVRHSRTPSADSNGIKIAEVMCPESCSWRKRVRQNNKLTRDSLALCTTPCSPLLRSSQSRKGLATSP
jgi:hypothetical protein